MTKKKYVKKQKKAKVIKKTIEGKNEKAYEIRLVILIASTIIFALSLITNSVGIIGNILKEFTFGLFSTAGHILPYTIFFIIFININKNLQKYRKRFTLALILLFISINLMFAINDFNVIRSIYAQDFMKIFSLSSMKISFDNGINLVGSGLITNLFAILLYKSIGKYGLLIITITFAIVSIILFTNLNIKNLTIKRKIKKRSAELTKKEVAVKNSLNDTKKEMTKDDRKDIKIYNYNDFKDSDDAKEEKRSDIITALDRNVQSKIVMYDKPRYTFLDKPKNKSSQLDKTEIIKNAEILERTLNNFGIDAKVIEISKGPSITRFELLPKPGTKISKIVNLSDDIALNLAVSQVRVAPVPGKVAVGIEVPNGENSMVKIREILESEEFKRSKSKLAIALGKNIAGKPVVFDLMKMPHLLIAGATGSGKSVCVNTIIASILFNASPDEVKLLMIDPKVVELNIYNGIPHLILPVVTDPKKASIALGWAVNEMNRRYGLFAEEQVKDIEAYNNKNTEQSLPQIVIIIDELADLMMVASSQVEDSIARLSQMARASGIHLIVATQRPSVDVITGLIKANITSRIAFSVSSQVDSRTILDTSGAEKLLGRGDMLFNPVGASKPVRLQGAFISEKEIEKIVQHIKSQAGHVEYNDEILTESESAFDKTKLDDLMPKVIMFLSTQKTVSVSMLQRKFRIGYNRAARIMDDLEEKNIVSMPNGSKPRDVLLTVEQIEEYK